MTRECHVRFCERLQGQFQRPTHHFGMKAHVGVDASSGLVHTAGVTSGNVRSQTCISPAGHLRIDNPLMGRSWTMLVLLGWELA